jgi:hypothetical protein
MPLEAVFCSQCGARLDADGAEAGPRHLVGVLTPGPAFILGCVLLVGGVLALIAGSTVAAIALLAFAAAVFVLFYGAAERDSGSTFVRRSRSAIHRVRGWGVFARRSGTAWAAATRDVARLTREARSLRRERARLVVELGEAAYHEDAASVGAVRLRLREVDDALRTREQARATTLREARRHVRDEREAAQATKSFSVSDLTSGGRGDS